MDANLVNKESSELSYAKELAHMARACTGVVHVRTDEIWRTAMATRATVLSSMNEEYAEWDMANGLVEMTTDNLYSLGHMHPDAITFGALLVDIADYANGEEDKNSTKLKYFVAVNAHNWWGTPPAISLLQQLVLLLPSSNTRLILITPDIPPPDELSGWATINFGAPSFAELEDCATTLIRSIDSPITKALDKEDIKDICYAGMGMARDAFEMHLSVGLTQHDSKGKSGATAESLIESVNIGKTDILNSSDLLELYKKEDMAHVGGMENLKSWVSKRSNCYSEEAKAHGVESPKGCVLLGPPGVGKSLSAKAIASVMGVPLIRLDFGKVFNSLVGSSEQRIRKALQDVEDMAPLVLMIDEVDKGLGGIGGSGDSGTSSRVLGTFLSWVNDNTSPVFVVMTANNIENLPPELLRRGRFDQIFAAGLPGEEERLDILRIHLTKRGWEEAIPAAKLPAIVSHMKGFVGAEIESTVKDALVNSFDEGKDLSYQHLIAASKAVVPLSVSYAEQIQAMTLWAKTHAVPAGKVEDDNVAPISNGAKRSRRLKAKNDGGE